MSKQVIQFAMIAAALVVCTKLSIDAIIIGAIALLVYNVGVHK
jgi:hypothetical protein